MLAVLIKLLLLLSTKNLLQFWFCKSKNLSSCVWMMAVDLWSTDSTVQHHVPDGPCEAAEKYVWQDTSAGHRHHACECIKICCSFNLLYLSLICTIRWYVDVNYHVIDWIKPLRMFSNLSYLFHQTCLVLTLCAAFWVGEPRKKKKILF